MNVPRTTRATKWYFLFLALSARITNVYSSSLRMHLPKHGARQTDRLPYEPNPNLRNRVLCGRIYRLCFPLQRAILSRSFRGATTAPEENRQWTEHAIENSTHFLKLFKLVSVARHEESPHYDVLGTIRECQAKSKPALSYSLAEENRVSFADFPQVLAAGPVFYSWYCACCDNMVAVSPQRKIACTRSVLSSLKAADFFNQQGIFVFKAKCKFYVKTNMQ